MSGSSVRLSTDGTVLRAGRSLGPMATLFRDGNGPPPKVLEIIMGHFHRVTSPVYVGILSLEIRWSLARTEEMLQHLAEQGLVRPMTSEEKKSQKIREDANLWVLAGKPELSKARF